MKFTIIKSCLARFSGTFAVGTPSNIHSTAISYRCAKFGVFVNSVTILTLRDLTKSEAASFPLFACTVFQRLRFGHSNEKIALQEQNQFLCVKS